MAEERPPDDGDVTTQPSISTEEAEATDVELSPVGDEQVVVPDEPPVLEVRDAAKRIVRMRIVPWRKVINTNLGLEMFEHGAFDDTDPAAIRLRMDHQDPPTGIGIGLTQERDAAYADFRVAKTSRGDDQLALISEGVSTGASVGFEEVPGGTSVESVNGRRVRVHRRVALREVSTTWRPAYEQAGVMYVRSNEPHTEIAPMADQEAPVAGAVVPVDDPRLAALIDKLDARAQAESILNEKFLERLESLEERARQNITVPNPGPEQPKIDKGEWIQMVVRLLTGDRVAEIQMRALDDVITTDNPGVVPAAFLTELIGVIDNRRPFLSTTRRLPTPASGMKLTVPVITQRPTAEVQSVEKTEVSSQKTLIGTEDFNAITIAGAGDLSIQIIKRSSPDFLNLWVELLAEAYAIESEDQAILAMLNSMGGVGAATALNPEDLDLGAAYVAAFDAIRRPPDTIWLSTQAVGEFIDAKASGTNAPLYPGLNASATAAGGVTGVVSGLRPVHVPALDAHGAYAIVGPSSGFAWAEDGTYTLQVDVPSKAGRDVALVGILWPAPWYPAAFTAFNVTS
jgi:HK97 family phage prohead protease/HK97 family phage major capsid protein